MAAELSRASPPAPTSPVVLALHPGEVATDMAAQTSVAWEVEGVITARESVTCMLDVIGRKGKGGPEEGGGRPGKATFWTWEGEEYPW